MYIVLEGVVGTGKSTQSRRLVKALEERYPGKEALLVREPGGGPIAEAIRELVQARTFDEDMHPVTDAYLYAAARAQLIQSTIVPVLANGGIVVSDRNVCSSLAYQGRAQGLGINHVWDINAAAIAGAMPDKILFMDMPVAAGLRRTFDADGDKRERLDQNFFHRVYAGYEQLFSFAPLTDIMHCIDAQGTKKEVEERIGEVVFS